MHIIFIFMSDHIKKQEVKKCLNPSCKDEKSDCGGRCNLCKAPLCYWLGNDEGDIYCSLYCETYLYKTRKEGDKPS